MVDVSHRFGRLLLTAALLALPLFAQAPTEVQDLDHQERAHTLFGKKEPKPTAATTRVFRGHVTDKNGNSVAGAIVEARAPGGNPVSATTDEQGLFAIEGLKATADYEVKARKEGLAPVMRKVSQYDSRKEVYLNFLLRPDRERATAAKNDAK